MRWLLFLLLAPATLFGAAGDITAVNVEANGWVLNATFEGPTNGTFAFGFGTNNSISGSEKVILTVTSPGFDSTGMSNAVTRTVYGTKQLRLPYPQNTVNDVITNDSAGTCEIRVALSDFIYSGDTATFSILSGLYGGNNAASGTATINSTRTYPKAVANWTWPGWNRETGATMRLRAVGFHQSADNGQPLACMKFIVSQTNGVSVTNTVASMTVDRTLSDAIPTAEYLSDFILSVFTNYTSGGDDGLLRCNFEAYPRIGDSTAVLATTDSSTFTPLAATLTNLCDRLGTYSTFIAVVDPAATDANGAATNCAPENVNSGHYFLSIGHAAVHLQGSNNAFCGHNDAGGGIIYVRSGITNYTGATATTTTPAAWLLIQPYPGDTVSNLTTSLTAGYASHLTKLYQMKVGGSGNLFYTGSGLWLDQCTIESTASLLFRSALLHLTDCNIPTLSQGIKYSTGLMPSLIRGNSFGNLLDDCSPVQTWIANVMTSNDLCVLAVDMNAMTTPVPQGVIIYNNRFNFHIASGSHLLGHGYYDVDYRGVAIVQNLFESSTNNTSSLCAYGMANKTITNMLWWHNVFTGQRTDLCYNWSTATNAVRTQVQLLNNLMDDYNLKTDSTSTADTDCTNNWEQVWAVSWQGNLFAEVTNAAAAPKDFLNTIAGGFAGLETIENTVISSVFYPRYIDRQSYDGATGNWPGNGNYRVHSDAPQQLLRTRWVLPYDLEGNARGRLDPPGAYSSASPRKGGGFF